MHHALMALLRLRRRGWCCGPYRLDVLVRQLQLSLQAARHAGRQTAVCLVRVLQYQPGHGAGRLLDPVGVQSVVLGQPAPMVRRQLPGTPGAAYLHGKAAVHVRPVRRGEHVVHRGDSDALRTEDDGVVLGVRVGVADGRVQRQPADPFVRQGVGRVGTPQYGYDLLRLDAILVLGVVPDGLHHVLRVNTADRSVGVPFTVEAFDDI